MFVFFFRCRAISQPNQEANKANKAKPTKPKKPIKPRSHTGSGTRKTNKKLKINNKNPKTNGTLQTLVSDGTVRWNLWASQECQSTTQFPAYKVLPCTISGTSWENLRCSEFLAGSASAHWQQKPHSFQLRNPNFPKKRVKSLMTTRLRNVADLSQKIRMCNLGQHILFAVQVNSTIPFLKPQSAAMESQPFRDPVLATRRQHLRWDPLALGVLLSGWSQSKWKILESR